jgi:hypothetical protein
MNKKTTIVTGTSEVYNGMIVYAVEPVHTMLGIVCCVVSQYRLEDGEVVDIVFDYQLKRNDVVPVTQNERYKWVKLVGHEKNSDKN